MVQDNRKEREKQKHPSSATFSTMARRVLHLPLATGWAGLRILLSGEEMRYEDSAPLCKLSFNPARRRGSEGTKGQGQTGGTRRGRCHQRPLPGQPKLKDLSVHICHFLATGWSLGEKRLRKDQ